MAACAFDTIVRGAAIGAGSTMAHEDFARAHPIERSSDRAFGWVLAGVWLAVALWPLTSGRPATGWAVALAVACVLIALLRPSLLAIPNRAWNRLGIVLGKVVSPVVLGVLYYGVITPLGLLMRATGKDPLRRKTDRAAQSYWIPREPPGPPPDSMTNQF